MTRQPCCFIFLATEYVVAHVLPNHPYKKDIKYQLTLNNTKMKTKITNIKKSNFFEVFVLTLV